jgi:uncharacterized membrane protein
MNGSKSLEKKQDMAMALLLLVLCTGLILMPTGFEKCVSKNAMHAKGQVISVDNSDVRRNLIVKSGIQRLEVELLNGPFAGQTIPVANHLQGKMELDEVYVASHKILVEFTAKKDVIHAAYARGHYRLNVELILMGIFGVTLIAVGGWTGFKALLSFLFAALMLWKVMVPSFLKGYDPILIALAVVFLLTSTISFMVGGLNRRGVVTFCGSFLGLLLTSVLALVFSKAFRLHGAVRPFAETLLYSGFYYLDLTRIFIAGIFVASSGAVMDLAMDIAASMSEIAHRNPDISVKDHIASGMAVGRSVIGTMTTTLLLAYSGSYIAMLMLFMGQGRPLVTILNLNFVAAEILNTIVGSFGLVTVAPFTALAGGLIFGYRKKERDSVLPPAIDEPSDLKRRV